MSQLDVAVFLVAGISGVVIDCRVPWGIVGVWALLKLLHVL